MSVKLYQTVGSFTRNASLSSAVTLTKPTGATHLLIQILSNDVVITFDGTTPTTTNGFILLKNNTYEFTLHATTSIKVIEYAASAEIRYQFFAENVL